MTQSFHKLNVTQSFHELNVAVFSYTISCGAQSSKHEWSRDSVLCKPSERNQKQKISQEVVRNACETICYVAFQLSTTLNTHAAHEYEVETLIETIQLVAFYMKL